MQTIFDRPHAVKYISHRGFQPLAPENSLPSFEYAGLLGQWAIETDVHVTLDGQLVCCHDERLERTFDGEGRIEEMTWAELSALRTPEARFYKALDRMEAVIAHNESDISTWLPLEYELQRTYGIQDAAHFSWLQALRAAVLQETEEKIAAAKQEATL